MISSPSTTIKCRFACFSPIRKHGFSLVEVTLAIGIVSFAIISLFGLMSAGSTTVVDAINSSVHAQIISQVASTTLLTPFSEIDTFVSNSSTNTPMRFNRAATVTTDSTNTFYTASLTFTPTQAPVFPGATSGLGNYARAVVIEVATVRPGTIVAITTSRSIVIVPK